jgi:hypothetical protein
MINFAAAYEQHALQEQATRTFHLVVSVCQYLSIGVWSDPFYFFWIFSLLLLFIYRLVIGRSHALRWEYVFNINTAK